MQINGSTGYSPSISAYAGRSRLEAAKASGSPFEIDRASGGDLPAGVVMKSGAGDPPVDAQTILDNWGTSNAVADLNTDGIVDAQDLALVLNQAQGSTSGSSDGEDPWTALTGGDLNGDGAVDAMDLAMRLHNESGDSNSFRSGDAGGAVDAAPSVEAMPELDSLTKTAGGLIERLSNAIFDTFDADGDGVIVKDDMPRGAKIFDRFDRDGTGSVDRNELQEGLMAEFRRYAESVKDADPRAFASRWMEAFSGTRSMPEYGAASRLSALFGAAEPFNPLAFASQSNMHGILSAKA